MMTILWFVFGDPWEKEAEEAKQDLPTSRIIPVAQGSKGRNIERGCRVLNTSKRI